MEIEEDNKDGEKDIAGLVFSDGSKGIKFAGGGAGEVFKE